MTEFLMKADHLETLILHDNIFGSAGAVVCGLLVVWGYACRSWRRWLRSLALSWRSWMWRTMNLVLVLLNSFILFVWMSPAVLLCVLDTEERPIHINIEDEIYDDVEDYDEIDVLCNENWMWLMCCFSLLLSRLLFCLLFIWLKAIGVEEFNKWLLQDRIFS